MAFLQEFGSFDMLAKYFEMTAFESYKGNCYFLVGKFPKSSESFHLTHQSRFLILRKCFKFFNQIERFRFAIAILVFPYFIQ